MQTARTTVVVQQHAPLSSLLQAGYPPWSVVTSPDNGSLVCVAAREKFITKIKNKTYSIFAANPNEERNRNFYPYPQIERDNNTNTPDDPTI